MSISINIRSIQHYMYCPRRFGLLEINNDWAENAYVAAANIMHENVHSGEHGYSCRNGFCESSVILYNDELDIFGVADCIEFEKSEKGCYIEKLDGKYIIKIVEYKPRRPKDGSISETDAVQVFAQKLCVDYVFGCSCESYIYYSDVRRRTKLPFDAEYDKYCNMISIFTKEMREILERGKIPLRLKNQECGGCSLSDICMSKSIKYSVKGQIISDIKEAL